MGDPDFYKSKLVGALGNQFSTEGFTIEKKADATYKIVSAGLSVESLREEIRWSPSHRLSASIIAKVTRDDLLKKWKWNGVGVIDSNYGSGYPSDEVCVNWYA